MYHTLTNLIAKLKSLPLKYKMVIGVMFLSLLFIIINFLTPSPPPPPSPISPTSLISPTPSVSPPSDKLTITYVGPAISIPTTLPTYSLTPTPFIKFAQAFAQSLQLDPHPNVSNMWVTKDKQGGLVANSQDKIINYTLSAPKASPKPGITPAFAVSTAKNFLNNLGLTNTTILESQITYLSGDSETQTTTSTLATYAQIPFTYTIDSYPLLVTPKPNTSHEVVIRSDGQVLKINFSLPPISSTSLPPVPLLSFDEALIALEDRQGTTVTLQLPHPSLDSPPPTSLRLTSAHLEYRPQNKQVVPFYNFTGTASTKGLNNLPITIILPATK